MCIELQVYNKITDSPFAVVIQVDEVRGTVQVAHPNTSNNDPPKVFTFDTTFGENCKQVDVYNEVARPIVEFVLEGYNGRSLIEDSSC